MIIGITGYIGVGKTTATRILAEKGLDVIDVDKLGHDLLKDKEIKNKIIGTFGESVTDRKLEIDRKKLGRLVFSNQEYLKTLNKIIHSKLKEMLYGMLKQAASTKKSIIIDVALLNEFGLEEFCDYVVLVKADLEKVYQRMVKGYDKKHILIIMNNQKMPKDPDFIIDNNGSFEEFNREIERIWKCIAKDAAQC